MRHILGEKRLLRWQNRAPRLEPAHSKRPWSRDTEKVISVGVVLTPTLWRKLRKFAVLMLVRADQGWLERGDLRYVSEFMTMKPVSTSVLYFPLANSTVLVWPPRRSLASYM
jgi:hypothetical protein